MLLLIAPAAIVLVLFQIVPIVIGANASFRDWQLFNPAKTWVGFAHYAYVLTDPAFLGVVLPNTFLLMFFSVSLSLICGMALAHYLNRNFAGQWLIQTIILLPQMIAPVIAAMMMRWVFNDQFGVVAAGTLYHYRVRSKDAAGNLAVSSDATVTTGTGGQSVGLWTAGAAPAIASNSDAQAVSLGVKFRADVSGFIQGIRFYKGVRIPGCTRSACGRAAGGCWRRCRWRRGRRRRRDGSR